MLGAAPTPPLNYLLTVPEPTFEGLTRFLKEGQPSVGMFSTEGGQFVGGHAMSDDNKIKTAAGLSRLWDEGEARRSRQSEGTSIIRGRRLSVHLQVQPEVATRFFTDPALLDQGLLSRFLTTWPTSAIGLRPWREPSEKSQDVIDGYRKRALEILRWPLPLVGSRKNEVSPPVLRLSAGATEAWLAFYNNCETKVAPGGPLECVTPLANKAPEHAARLATVLTLFQNLDAREIDAEMTNGIYLVRFYLAEAVRIASLTRTDPDLLLAQRLLNWLQTLWVEKNNLISLPDIYQRSLNAICDKATAERMVDILVSHNWLRPAPAGEVNGTQRRQVWSIVRE